MTIWAIADLHLSFGIPDKKMDIFGPEWKDHPEKIAKAWKERIHDEDLVLLAGDISWANHLDQVQKDLEWIDRLPGKKLMIRGNHDYWWHSISKVRSQLPPSVYALQNDAFTWNDVSIGGARLWDTDEFTYEEYSDYRPKEKTISEKEEEKRIFARDLARLEMSLKSINPQAKTKIAMTHFPPIGPSLDKTQASHLFEKYQIDIVVFGHLHGLKKEKPLFVKETSIKYFLTSCDFLDFQPLRIL